MKPCVSCPKLPLCRVPRDMQVMDKVVHRLDEERRTGALRDRLHHYLDTDQCLVECGCVELRS